MTIIAKLNDGRVLAKVTGIIDTITTDTSIRVPDIGTIEEIISVNVVGGTSTVIHSSINTDAKTIDIIFASGATGEGTTGNVTVDVIVLGF
jgi:hypothetical protein